MLRLVLCLLLLFKDFLYSSASSAAPGGSEMEKKVEEYFQAEDWDWLAAELGAEMSEELAGKEEGTSLTAETTEAVTDDSSAYSANSSTAAPLQKRPNYRILTPEDFARFRSLAKEMLQVRYSECTGIFQESVPWQEVQIFGLPCPLSSNNPGFWNEQELRVFFSLFPSIRIIPKERCSDSFTNGRLYEDFKAVLMRLDSIQNNGNVNWRRLKSIAPDLNLFSHDYRRWNESDRAAIYHFIQTRAREYPDFDEVFGDSL